MAARKNERNLSVVPAGREGDSVHQPQPLVQSAKGRTGVVTHLRIVSSRTSVFRAEALEQSCSPGDFWSGLDAARYGRLFRKQHRPYLDNLLGDGERCYLLKLLQSDDLESEVKDQLAVALALAYSAFDARVLPEHLRRDSSKVVTDGAAFCWEVEALIHEEDGCELLLNLFGIEHLRQVILWAKKGELTWPEQFQEILLRTSAADRVVTPDEAQLELGQEYQHALAAITWAYPELQSGGLSWPLMCVEQYIRTDQLRAHRLVEVLVSKSLGIWTKTQLVSGIVLRLYTRDRSEDSRPMEMDDDYINISQVVRLFDHWLSHREDRGDFLWQVLDKRKLEELERGVTLRNLSLPRTICDVIVSAHISNHMPRTPETSPGIEEHSLTEAAQEAEAVRGGVERTIGGVPEPLPVSKFAADIPGYLERVQESRESFRLAAHRKVKADLVPYDDLVHSELETVASGYLKGNHTRFLDRVRDRSESLAIVSDQHRAALIPSPQKELPPKESKYDRRTKERERSRKRRGKNSVAVSERHREFGLSDDEKLRLQYTADLLPDETKEAAEDYRVKKRSKTLLKTHKDA